jgi:ATP-dependent helicase HrpA
MPQPSALYPHIDHQEWHRDGLTSWDFPRLPREVRVVRGGIDIAMYPAVIDEGASVRLRLIDSQDGARQLTHDGIRRLFALAHQRALRQQARWLPRWEEVCVLAAPLMTKTALQDQVRDLIADRAFLGDRQLPVDQSEFAARCQEAGQRIAVATQEVAEVLPRIFASLHRAHLALERLTAGRWQEARDDITAQLRELTPDDFLTSTPWSWLAQLPRYFDAVEYRVGKLASGGQVRDDECTRNVARFWNPYAQHRASALTPWLSPELVLYRWMIEEFRVSLFAQPLGTSIKVSPQRLEKQWAEVTRPVLLPQQRHPS